MSADVDWVLDQLASVVDSVATDYSITNQDGTASDVVIKRVDRDDAQVYEGSQSVDMTTPITERTGELQTGCFIGATQASGAEEPIGTEYDLDIEHVVGLRVEGLHESQFGHVDPAGEDGIPFDELKHRIRMALYNGREYPSAGRSNVSFTHLQLTNPAPQSDDWQHYFRWDVDVVFDGFEDLS
ncbi:hypothetical protein [Haloarcula sp. K1]|uniref:hypothetical protein n=1 Tax=Haloarcula sp. K1 TaxID=1622207 RepID=UPI0007BB70B8|nr:hypothetical protein [Haloarcula sp. K1]KZX49297.1 hypothetical protein AV929_12190 [Haloarcula sp. K1]